MPDKRRHRGAHSEDKRLFAPAAVVTLRQALADLVWLLDRGYAEKSGLKLVGDRYRLHQRQRLAVMRSVCATAAQAARAQCEADAATVGGAILHVDGYNVITTVETALAGGVVLIGRDGCCRDIAGVHGTFRKVEETVPAVALIGAEIERLGPRQTHWYLDRPVSNSGRLKALLQEMAAEHGWGWRVDVVTSPDYVLKHTGDVAVSSDSEILSAGGMWFNLTRRVIETAVPRAWCVNLEDR